MNEVLLFEEESYQIRGAIFEVYREMGCGFLEAVYQECLEKELNKQRIPFIAQPELELFYKDEKLQQTYKPDLICYDQIIVELKAVREVCDEHRAQLHNYLKATGLKLGLLVNFGHYPKATIERIVK
ncbi:GTP-binding protein [Marispirochaeta aestuarii]|uniref:GTP-binding protein n=1 Tax=Marispirochaeta aestuarii TaxID=1963862 RepID=A0A1Y1RYR8_9SPIO|nr:GxxExxY protein [Marispirochaeta aestuarii]ORC35713.1 GTP-binding protein [Marispirochaeta aestuarii]